MGILTRFKDIMSANINALLDKAEDPAKMVDELLRKANEDLAKVKDETAAVMANEKRDRRALDDCKAKIEKMKTAAQNALGEGNEDDASKLIARKQELEAQLPSLESNYNASSQEAAQMRKMHDKLVNDINTLDSRRAAVKAKVANAKAQETINKVSGSMGVGSDIAGALGKLEDKAQERLDKAMAEAELNNPGEDADEIADKYTGGVTNASVADELARMKKELGLANPSDGE